MQQNTQSPSSPSDFSLSHSLNAVRSLMSANPMHGILSGMRIIEVSAFVAAPSCGLALAQMGADVIRVDDVRGALDYRRWPVDEQNNSLFWQGLNKSKRSVSINIREAKGRELVKELISAPGEHSGILLTNFPPRGWLDYENLREARKDLIQLTILGNRQGDSAVDYTVNPSVGVPGFTGPEDSDHPVNSVLPSWDCITGQMAVSALLAAERHRRLTGQGQHIKLALEDVALATLGNLGFFAEAEVGAERERIGNYLFGAFGRDFVSKDGVRVMVVGLTPKQWSGLCKATNLTADMQALGENSGLDLSQEGNRFKARREIAGLIEAWMKTQNFNVVCEAFDAHGVCWSRYQTVKQLLAEEPNCSDQNPMLVRQEQPGIGEFLMAGSPISFGGVERQSPGIAPQPGEHTRTVLADVLGYDDSQLNDLNGRGIIGGS